MNAVRADISQEILVNRLDGELKQILAAWHFGESKGSHEKRIELKCAMVSLRLKMVQKMTCLLRQAGDNPLFQAITESAEVRRGAKDVPGVDPVLNATAKCI